MTIENQVNQLKHTFTVCGLLLGIPSLLKIPDAIDSALNKDRDVLSKDLNSIIFWCIADVATLLLQNEKEGSIYHLKLENAKNLYKNGMILEAKNACIDILNDLQSDLVVSKLRNE